VQGAEHRDENRRVSKHKLKVLCIYVVVISVCGGWGSVFNRTDFALNSALFSVFLLPLMVHGRYNKYRKTAGNREVDVLYFLS
jgi:hypothetical protein